MGTLIRTGVLKNYFTVAQRLGLEPEPLLRKLRLSSEMLADPDQWISGSGAVTLLEESARITQCPTFGLRMADLWQLSDLGVVSVLLTHQRTLRDAVGTLIQFRHLMNEFLVIRIEEVGKKVIVREDVVADDVGPSIQSVELALGTLSRMCSTRRRGLLRHGQWRTARSRHPLYGQRKPLAGTHCRVARILLLWLVRPLVHGAVRDDADAVGQH